MDNEKLRKILTIIADALKDTGVFWHLIGSSNLAVQGMPVEPRDIDITTLPEFQPKIKEVLQKYIKKDFYKPEFPAQMLIMEIQGIEVEFVGRNPDDKLVMRERTEFIEWKGLELPILPLRFAKEWYEIEGRPEKGKKIEEFLNQ